MVVGNVLCFFLLLVITQKLFPSSSVLPLRLWHKCGTTLRRSECEALESALAVAKARKEIFFGGGKASILHPKQAFGCSNLRGEDHVVELLLGGHFGGSPGQRELFETSSEVSAFPLSPGRLLQLRPLLIKAACLRPGHQFEKLLALQRRHG